MKRIETTKHLFNKLYGKRIRNSRCMCAVGSLVVILRERTETRRSQTFPTCIPCNKMLIPPSCVFKFKIFAAALWTDTIPDNKIRTTTDMTLAEFVNHHVFCIHRLCHHFITPCASHYLMMNILKHTWTYRQVICNETALLACILNYYSHNM